jgi:hypothetical protein
MANNETCTCPKRAIGQGWIKGVWREGVSVEPTNHLDTCPKFEDYSTGGLAWLEEAVALNLF